jgi:hypothetical protein
LSGVALRTPWNVPCEWHTSQVRPIP